MNKKDFMTPEEYTKALSNPKPSKEDKPKPKLIELKSKEELGDEPMAMDDAYEAYKLEWLEEHGYTVYDLITAVVDYAAENKRMKDLEENPAQVVSDWEDNAGFGVEMYEDYDTWASNIEDDGTFDKGQLKQIDAVDDIIDFFDMGYAADEIEELGYDTKDVELATQYYNGMCVGQKR